MFAHRVWQLEIKQKRGWGEGHRGGGRLLIFSMRVWNPAASADCTLGDAPYKPSSGMQSPHTHFQAPILGSSNVFPTGLSESRDLELRDVRGRSRSHIQQSSPPWSFQNAARMQSERKVWGGVWHMSHHHLSEEINKVCLQARRRRWR